MGRIKRRHKLILFIFPLAICAVAAAVLFQLYTSDDAGYTFKPEDAFTENREITGGDYDASLAAKCDNGTFIGRSLNDVRAYKGIPYAAPPVGELRWKPPVDAASDDGVYEAYHFGRSCIQTEASSERASYYAQGEDCLTLNVWTAAADGDAPKAVMVFFHGGSFGWGGTADPIYDGQHLIEAHRDVVLVTANYRIGMLGFIDFSEVPGGDAYAESGNLGLLDQVSALRWVRRNIACFGGDPDNVTIFGESAGASSVSLLPLIKDAKGLFHRVIAQSGSLAFSFSREECRHLTQMLLEETGAKSMEDLVALSEKDIMRVNEKLNDYINFPERDGVVLPEDLYAAYAAGEASHVDMLTGTNADETRYFIDEVGGYAAYVYAGPLVYRSIVKRIDPPDRRYADAFLALQQGDSIWRMTEFMNDLVFRGPAVAQAELHAENGGRHYMYYWTKESAIEQMGACHAVELAYVFNNLDDTIYTGERADEELAGIVQEMWVQFAKTGDPSFGAYGWAPYDGVDRMTMVLGDDIHMASDPLPEQRVLIAPLLKYRFNGQYRAVDYALLYLRDRVIRELLTLAGICAAAFIAHRIAKLLRKMNKRRHKPA